MEWISVKDRLPKIEEEVLAYAGKKPWGPDIHVGNLQEGYDSIYWTYYDYLEWHDVTHWMPLPEPPKEQEVLGDFCPYPGG